MLDVIKELLEAGVIGDEETATKIDAAVTEKLAKPLREENAQWRVKYQDTLKALEEVKTTKEKLEATVGSLDEKIAKAKEEGKSELVVELEKERAEREELAKKLGEYEAVSKKYRIETEIRRAFDGFDYEPIDPDVLELIKSKADIDGENVVVGGKPVSEALKEYVEAKPALFRAKGKGGSGVGGEPPHGSGGEKPDAAKIAEMMKDPAQRDKAMKLLKEMKGK